MVGNSGHLRYIWEFVLLPVDGGGNDEATLLAIALLQRVGRLTILAFGSPRYKVMKALVKKQILALRLKRSVTAGKSAVELTEMVRLWLALEEAGKLNAVGGKGTVEK